MIFWLTKSVILSLLLISIIHYLYIFLKNNLTQPKIKDLIDHPKKEYEDILEIINKGNNVSNIKIQKLVQLKFLIYLIIQKKKVI